MASRTRLSASLALAAVLCGASAARAAEPPAEEVPLEFEAGRTAGQFLLGTVTAMAGGWLALSSGNGGAALFVMALTPAAVGGATCKVGLEGRHDGSCAVTIMGSYLGAATMIPLAYLGYYTDPPLDDGRRERDLYYGNAILGAAMGWLLMQPLGATLGWHFSRSPRQAITVGPPLPLPSTPLAFDRSRRRPFAGRPRPLLPFLSLRF